MTLKWQHSRLHKGARMWRKQRTAALFPFQDGKTLKKKKKMDKHKFVMWDIPTHFCRFNCHGTVFSHVQLCEAMDYSLPGCSAHGVFQARILEWVAISYSRASSRPTDQTHISRITCFGRWIPLPLCRLGSPLTISDLFSLSLNAFCSGHSGFPNLGFDLWWWALTKLSANHFICLPAHPPPPAPLAQLAQAQHHASTSRFWTSLPATSCQQSGCSGSCRR